MINHRFSFSGKLMHDLKKTFTFYQSTQSESERYVSQVLEILLLTID